MSEHQTTASEPRSEDPWDAEPDPRPWWRKKLPLLVVAGLLSTGFLTAIIFGWD